MPVRLQRACFHERLTASSARSLNRSGRSSVSGSLSHIIGNVTNIADTSDIADTTTFVDMANLGDVTNLADVDKLANKLAQELDRLDLVICNAGIGQAPYGMTSDGLERHFEVRLFSF